MFHSKKIKKEVLDQQILDLIFYMRNQWSYLEGIMDRSIEPSEEGRCDLAIAKVKYFYLLREAKERNISVLK